MALAVLMSGLAGCGETRPAGTGLTEAGLDLAVRSGPYRDDQRLLMGAEHELTRRCMLAHRFDYPTSTGAPAGEDDSWRPDLDTRRGSGYGLTDSGRSTPARYPSDLPAARRSAYLWALSGDPTRRATLRLSSGPRFTFATTGCIAESRAALFGDIVTAARVAYVPQEAYNALYKRVEGDADTRAALGAWATCMGKRGYRYASMSAARADVSRAIRAVGPGDATRRFEIRVAVADGECAIAAGLPTVVDRVGRRYAVELSAKQRRDLNLAAASRVDGLRRARGIVPCTAAEPGCQVRS